MHNPNSYPMPRTEQVGAFLFLAPARCVYYIQYNNKMQEIFNKKPLFSGFLLRT